MKIKKGDTVIVIAGKDKGKKGEVLDVLKKENKVLVSGVNVRIKHQKPRGPQQPGGRTESEGPIDLSNVMFYDQKSGKGTRVGYSLEGGKKVRINKKSGAKIDK